LIIVVGFNIYQ